MSKTQPRHTEPTPLEALTPLLSHTASRRVFCIAQYSPSPQVVNRYLCFEWDSHGLRFHRSDWITREDWAQLKPQIEAHRHIIGSCDAMYHTAPSLIWFEAEGLFYLYDDQTLLLQCSPTELKFKEQGISKTDLSHIHAALSSDWVVRSLKIVLQSGLSHTLVEYHEDMAIIDPCYDAIDLICDASWLSAVGRDLSRFMGIELHMDEGL